MDIQIYISECYLVEGGDKNNDNDNDNQNEKHIDKHKYKDIYKFCLIKGADSLSQDDKILLSRLLLLLNPSYQVSI